MLALKSVGAVALFGIFNAAEGRLMMAPTPGSSAPDMSDENKKKTRGYMKQCLIGNKHKDYTKHCMKNTGGENMGDDELIDKLIPPADQAFQDDVLKNCPDFGDKMNACFDALK